MSEVIDLDALIPQEVTIRFGGEELKIPPPNLEDVMRIGSLSQQMSKIDPENLDSATTTVTQLTNLIKKCVPALENKSLNSVQLMKLVNILTEMSVPKDAKELKERGITADTPKETA